MLELHRQYETALVKACWRHVHYDPLYLELAEDCVQETFLLLFERYDQLANHPCMGRWLLLTCMHKLDNALYKRHVREKRAAFSMNEYPELSLPERQSNIDRWLDADYAQECIQRVRETLTEKESTVFEDYFLEGLTAAEIAYKRSVTEGSVKSILRKIRKKARREQLDAFLLALGILSRFH